jgi:hypothetical protein
VPGKQVDLGWDRKKRLDMFGEIPELGSEQEPKCKKNGKRQTDRVFFLFFNFRLT